MHLALALIWCFTFLLHLCYCEDASITKAYNKALDAYTGERWTECITQFEEVLHLYKIHKSLMENCLFTCNTFHNLDVENDYVKIRSFEFVINKRNCFSNCIGKGLSEAHLKEEISDKVFHNLQSCKPYEYLHMCYFQMNAWTKAASAAYTYLMANINDVQMLKNYNYYIEQPEVDKKGVINYEKEQYVAMYELGIHAYNHQNWLETAGAMEEVLNDYSASENNCRLKCEIQNNHIDNTNYLYGIPNIIYNLLLCKQKCQDMVLVLNYQNGLEFIADVLNYLQISYYHLNKLSDAAQAVETYLLVNPNDEDMIENKNIYSTLVSPKKFSIRNDILFFFNRDKYEKKLLTTLSNLGDETTEYSKLVIRHTF